MSGKPSSEIRVVPYTPPMSDLCLALERDAPQGDAIQMTFQRKTFHKRSENFENWSIKVAMEGKETLGVAAMAYKTGLFRGEKATAACFYDLRVHPKARRRGVARALAEALLREADRAHIRLRYAYCLGDNRAALALGTLLGGAPVGGYQYLVWPVYRALPATATRRRVPSEQVHTRTWDAARPFDFYFNPQTGGKLQGAAGSFTVAGAACSLWSNEGILEEVVHSIPWKYGAGRALLGVWPFKKGPLPPLPKTGQALRSWIVHDFSATKPGAALELMSLINNDALERGVDYCYVVVPNGTATWLEELRAATPRFFSPLIPYTLVMRDTQGPVPPLANVHVDIRDI